MSTSQPKWISHLHVVLPDGAQKRVWLLPGDGGWALPSLDVEGGVWVGDASRLIPLLRERLGLTGNFTILRHAGLSYDGEARQDRAFPVVEFQQSVDEPIPGGRWVDTDSLARLPLADENRRALLSAFLHETEPPALRAPWARPGWFSQAAAWMSETLTSLGRPPTAPVEQYKCLGISTVLRTPTQAGLVYMKATAKLPLFINEGAVMAGLSDRFPGQIPRPLALNVQENWMLLDDFGPDLRTQKAEETDVAAFLGQFGELQARTAETVDELLDLGCSDRRLPVLARQLDELAAHPLTARHMTPAQLAALQAALPGLHARCDEVGRYRLPDCLVHGDLHLGNVARQGDGYQVFDWSDSCIGHPFVDMIAPYFFYDDAGVRERLRDAYLARWQAWESMDRLLELWRLAKPLAALHQAVSYLHILLGTEEVTHREMASGLRDFVEFTVQALDEI